MKTIILEKPGHFIFTNTELDKKLGVDEVLIIMLFRVINLFSPIPGF